MTDTVNNLPMPDAAWEGFVQGFKAMQEHRPAYLTDVKLGHEDPANPGTSIVTETIARVDIQQTTPDGMYVIAHVQRFISHDEIVGMTGPIPA